MRILIIDRYDHHDQAQFDMYQLVQKEHELFYASGNELFEYLDSVDLVWLGIYHQELSIYWGAFIIHCHVPVIVDNADNEEFLEKSANVPYQFMRKVFTSRYLPNDAMTKVGMLYNAPVMQLSWYVNPMRILQAEKSIDLSLIGTIHGSREKLFSDIKKIAIANRWNYYIGEAWGQEYYLKLAQSRVFFADCSRNCLTQKYIEASLSGCVIIGDVPLYPANNLKVISAGVSNIIPAFNEALQSEPSTWVSPFLSDFKKILHEAGR